MHTKARLVGRAGWMGIIEVYAPLYVFLSIATIVLTREI